MKNKVTKKTEIFYHCSLCGKENKSKKKAEKCHDSHLTSRRCIACLKVFKTDDKSIIFDHYNGCSLHVKDVCGYGSEHDMVKVDFVVCSKCMDKFIRS